MMKTFCKIFTSGNIRTQQYADIELRSTRQLYSIKRKTAATGIVFFAWGEIYSLFPSTCADTFDGQVATASSGLLYIVKGTVSFTVGRIGGNWRWYAMFIVASALNAGAALMAWSVLKSMRAKRMSKPALAE